MLSWKNLMLTASFAVLPACGSEAVDASNDAEQAEGLLRAGDLSSAMALEYSVAPAGTGTVHAAALMPGDFDPTFAGGGMAFYSVNGPQYVVSSKTLTQPDGKIIVSGTLTTSGIGCEAYVSRFNPNGSPDTTFAGGAGLMKVHLSTSPNCYEAPAALQSDGKIVVAATRENFVYPTTSDIVLIRFNSNGYPDTTFGPSGGVTFHYGDRDIASDVAVTWSGEIVVGGTFNNGFSASDFVVARFSNTGALLSSASYGFPSGNTDALARIKLQPDGKILAFGNTIAPGGYADFALARFNAWGSVDTSFGFGGGLRIDVFGYHDGAGALAVQPDGKILVGGDSYRASNDRHYMTLFRLNASGTAFDPAFGGGSGQAYVTFGAGTINLIADLALQSDGKIVAAGRYNSDVALLRFTPGGALDNTFLGGGGFWFDTAPNSVDATTGVALQPDGKIILGGSSDNILRLSRHLK
jgi:uncharacterized delta-60 repeat protein